MCVCLTYARTNVPAHENWENEKIERKLVDVGFLLSAVVRPGRCVYVFVEKNENISLFQKRLSLHHLTTEAQALTHSYT